jgi:hypothetical protein
MLGRCPFSTSCLLRLEVKFIKIGGKIICQRNGLPSALGLALEVLSDPDSERLSTVRSAFFRFYPVSDAK